MSQPASVVLKRGFLPLKDPVTHFPRTSELSVLDELGSTLPQRLQQESFRYDIRSIKLPTWTLKGLGENIPAYMRLYYVRIGFLASGYINQTGFPTARILPNNIAQPLVEICLRMQRPPILSYDGYALYNWHRLDRSKPVELGNIDTLQNFVNLYDEHWFILVHVEIEALGAQVVDRIYDITSHLNSGESAAINDNLLKIAGCIKRQERVLSRIPERMDPALYYKSFRPYIRFFEDVEYQGIEMEPMNYRGETGAQSSIMPALVALMKIPHQPSILTNHLADMRRYMPAPHREFIQWVESLPDLKPKASDEAFNLVLEAIAEFRRVHYSWAEEYINRHTDDPRGTGGTPYMQWLQQLIDETLSHRK